MKITAFDDLYPMQLGTGSTTLYGATGSNSGITGGDVVGEPGDLSVIRLGSTVSLGSNLSTGVALGDVLTIIQASPAVARFATPSNAAGSVNSNITNVAITAVFDGGVTALSSNSVVDLYVPFGATVTSSTVLADAATSAVVAVWRDTYANYPPTIADSITGANPPTLSAASKAQDTTLTGWTTAIPAGSTLRFSVASNSAASRLSVSLAATKTGG